MRAVAAMLKCVQVHSALSPREISVDKKSIDAVAPLGRARVRIVQVM